MGQVSTVRRGLSFAAAACGLLALCVGPASAVAASHHRTVPAPTLSIAINSAAPKITGHVWVEYGAKGYDSVTLTGSLSAARRGEVLILVAQPFPYTAAATAVPGQLISLSKSVTPVSYTFTAKPAIATRYFVELLPNAFETTPLLISEPRTVYVVAKQLTYGATTCPTLASRPVCHLTLHVYTVLPAAAYALEAPKRWYFYFGLRLDPKKEPSAPGFLFLSQSAKISQARQISPTEFERTITFSFRIGHDGYHYVLDICSKNTEAIDGINLPGGHGCGAVKVPARTFLG